MKLGDIMELGPHRLLCGDCTDATSVSRLFGDSLASTIIFSPPYKDRRKYGAAPAHDGTKLFTSALSLAPSVQDVQAFAIIGNLHSDGRQDLFYEPWIAASEDLGWRRFSTYIWDKQHGLPGYWSGRLAPCFEWIFHLNQRKRDPAKFRATLWGQGRHSRNFRFSKGNCIAKNSGKSLRVADYKIDDAIIRINPAGRAGSIGHPAVFPIELPERLLKSYGAPGGVVYDPMVGSGSTLLAADQLGLTCYATELNSDYCDIVIRRYTKQREACNKSSSLPV